MIKTDRQIAILNQWHEEGCYTQLKYLEPYYTFWERRQFRGESKAAREALSQARKMIKGQNKVTPSKQKVSEV